MELTLVVALFILYHLVPVWLGRTVHHVGEAVLLGSMHLLLASCFLLNAQGHDGRRVPQQGCCGGCCTRSACCWSAGMVALLLWLMEERDEGRDWSSPPW